MEMRLSEMWYREFEKCISEVHELEQALCYKEKKGQRESVISNLERLCSLSEQGREGGLLVLESLVYEHKNDWPAEILTGVQMVCDGCDPADVESVFWNKYFVRQPKGYVALQYLMNMKAVLEIQQGINPYALNNLLCSMLPDDIEKMYKERPKLP